MPKSVGIYRSSSGKYEFCYRDSDGRLRFETVHGGLEDAKAARADKIARMRKGVRVAPTRQTVEEYAADWFAQLTKRARTLEAYRYALDRHILPRLRHRKLASVTADDIAGLVAAMQREGYSGWTIAGALTVLSAMFAKAKRRGIVPSNPVAELERDERPTRGGNEKRILGEDDISAVLAAASNTFRPLIAVMIFGGLRAGEVLGLIWRDIDFDEGFIRVRRQLDRTRSRVDVKSKAARRNVVLMSQLAKLLKEHRLASRYSAESDFVFPAPDGRGRDHRSTSRGVERAAERAKLGEGVSAHTFRHTFASMLIVGLKLDPVRVADQLGHSDPATTLRVYAHLFEQARHADELRASLEAGYAHLLGGKRTSTHSRGQAQ